MPILFAALTGTLLVSALYSKLEPWQPRSTKQVGEWAEWAPLGHSHLFITVAPSSVVESAQGELKDWQEPQERRPDPNAPPRSIAVIPAPSPARKRARSARHHGRMAMWSCAGGEKPRDRRLLEETSKVPGGCRRCDVCIVYSFVCVWHSQ